VQSNCLTHDVRCAEQSLCERLADDDAVRLLKGRASIAGRERQIEDLEKLRIGVGDQAELTLTGCRQRHLLRKHDSSDVLEIGKGGTKMLRKRAGGDVNGDARLRLKAREDHRAFAALVIAVCVREILSPAPSQQEDDEPERQARNVDRGRTQMLAKV